eukprot:764515-Hanusia_phi.AAC.1
MVVQSVRELTDANEEDFIEVDVSALSTQRLTCCCLQALAETIGTVPGTSPLQATCPLLFFPPSPLSCFLCSLRLQGVARIQAVRHRRMGPYHIVDAQIEVQCELSVSAASQILPPPPPCAAPPSAEPELSRLLTRLELRSSVKCQR